MNKFLQKAAKIFLGLSMAAGVGVAVSSYKEAQSVSAADQTVTWTATAANNLGSTISSVGGTATGTITLSGTTNYSMSYTRTLASGADYMGYGATYGIQLGKNGGVETAVFTTSAIPGTIKSVSVYCGSYQGKHNISISVGGTTYLASTAMASGQTASEKSGSGTSSGQIEINITGGTRYFCIKTISVTYNNDQAADYVGSLSVSPSTWSGYDTQTLSVSNFTVSGSKNGTAGAVTSSDYDFQGIGYMSGDNFVARDASFSSGNPTTADTRLAWKAKYPTTAGGSTYAWAYVTLTVSEDSVQSLSITGSMTNTTYNQGDAWDPTGFTVYAYYASAPSTGVDVTSTVTWTYSETTESTSTTSVICTASFGGKSASSSAQTVEINFVPVVTFVASVDGSAGGSSLTKGGITISASNGAFSTDDFRIYKGATLTISSTVGDITQIDFTFSSTSYDGGGWASTYTPNSSSWTSPACTSGNSGEQARILTITVTYQPIIIVEATGMTISVSSNSVYVSDTVTITPTLTGGSGEYEKTISWTTSDATAIAKPSDSEDGVAFTVTALKAGTVTLTGTVVSPGSATNSVSITISNPAVPVTGVTLDKNSSSIAMGSTDTLTATVAPSNASNKHVTWSTGDSSIATVSEGVVIAVAPGTTSITVTTIDGGFTASCSVTVTAPASVTFLAGTDVGTSSGQNDDSIVKTGITMHCTSIHDTGDAYRYYSGSTLTFSSSIGKIAKIEFTGSDNSNKISNLGSETSGTLVVDATNNTASWTGSVDSVSFTLSAQGRASQVVVTLENTDPLVELDATSASSVSMMKDDSDTSIKVFVKNIETKTWSYTFDEGGNTGLVTSSYINVSEGAAVDNVHTLTITTKAVGSTVLHISVSGTACTSTVPVTVSAKPASMTVVHSDIVAGELEIITGSYKQVSFSGEDTDGNSYAIAAADVTPSATSGALHVTLSGSRITGESAGDAVVRYTLNALTSVYAEITVHVVDDYIESVGTPTFASNLADTQGDSPTVSIFTSRPGTMHSGTSTTVPFENYLFSYTDSYSTAEYGSVFSYDFSHGTTVDSTHKLQTIYVFSDIDEASHGSYTVTVEQFNDPLTAITFTNVTNNAVDVNRGSTFQLEWSYTPTNPTDGKEVVFRIDDNEDGISITVSQLGLISIGASSDLGTALVVIESAHDDTIYDYVYVTATLESMKYVVNETESLTPVSTVSSGDRVYMVATATDHSNQTYEFNGYPGTYGGATQYTTDVAKLQLLIVEAGTETGTVAFKLSGGDNDGEYISYSGSSNTLNHTSTKSASASWTVDGSTITNANTTARQIWLNWNNGTPRFACYTGKTSTTGYYCPTFVKVTGGNTDYNVTETLFNGIHDNFGAGKTYEWSESCPAFDSEAWEDACDALMGITGYSTYKLNRAVGNIAGNEIEVFISKYDNIIIKFGTAYDHLGRYANGGINYGQRVNINPLSSIIGKNTNAVAIIVIISMVSVTAIGGYFFLRKRKEN